MRSVRPALRVLSHLKTTLMKAQKRKIHNMCHAYTGKLKQKTFIQSYYHIFVSTHHETKFLLRRMNGKMRKKFKIERKNI